MQMHESLSLEIRRRRLSIEIAIDGVEAFSKSLSDMAASCQHLAASVQAFVSASHAAQPVYRNNPEVSCNAGSKLV